MLKRFLIVVSLSVLTFGSIAVAGEDKCEQKAGKCWNSFNSIKKTYVIYGMSAGMSVRNVAFSLAGLIFPPLSVDFGHVPKETTVGDIIKYFDKLYSYPVNRSIHWANAYLLAALNARDDDENDRLSLLRRLRDNEPLPQSGIWEEVKDVDRIIVLDTNDRHEIKLAGIDASEMNEETRAKALNVLNVLAYANYIGCVKERQKAAVMVHYFDDLFDKDGTITGYVEVFGNKICLGGESVEIWKASTFYLNRFILSKGLGKPDQGDDKKWSKGRRLARDMQLLLARTLQAKQKRLYVFGKGTDVVVERILIGLKPHY